MATADKLNKLLQTKQDIKQAIINKGVAVADTDTFASYATKIGEITAGSECSIIYQTNIPQLYLTGNTTGMTKENKVLLDAELKDEHGNIIFTGKKAKVGWQGNSSTNWPKKNFNMSFLEADGITKYKFQVFADVPANDGYHFKANMEDGTRLRNSLSYRIAESMYSKKLPSGQRSTMEGHYIEIHINGEYQGFYDFNTKQHKTVYGFDDANPNHLMYRGTDNASGSPEFRALSTNNAEDAGDWEDKFPATNTIENRAKLNRLIQWVMDCENNSTKFTTELEQYFDKEYLIKYVIYCYVIGGQDNTGNNMNLITFDGNIWYITFYDLDATWGYDYQERLLDTGAGLNMKKYYDSLLFDLVEANLANDIKTTYAELRQGVLSTTNILNEFNKAYFSNMDEIERDLAEWGTHCPSPNIAETRAWISGRMSYLDTYFQYSGGGETPIDPVDPPAGGITIPWMTGRNELIPSSGVVNANASEDICSEFIALKPGTYTFYCPGKCEWMGYAIYNYDTEVFEEGNDIWQRDATGLSISFTLNANQKVRLGANEAECDRTVFTLTTTNGGLVV